MLLKLYSILTLITAIGSYSIGLFIILKRRETLLNKIWFFLCLAIGGWNLGYYFTMSYSISKQTALLASRISHACGALIPALFFHFMVTFFENNKVKQLQIKLAYISCGIVAFLSLTPFVVTDLVPKMDMPYYPVGKIGYIIYVACFLFWVINAHALVPESFNALSSHKQKQLKYFLIGTILGFFGGANCFPLIFNIPVHPVLSTLILVYIFTTSYAILRHRLMDIEVIIKRTVVFAGVFVFVFAVVTTVAMLVSQLLGGINNFLSLAISALIISVSLRPIEAWLTEATNKFLFQKKYEYKQIIQAFIDEVITELNLDEVINSTLKLLDSTLHPYNTGIFILNKQDDKYQLYNSQGLENKDISFNSESKLVIFLKRNQHPATAKQIEGLTPVNHEIIQEMSSLKSVIALPLMLHDDLIGFLALGGKKSDEDYTKDDLDVLQDLARTESIAVANAQLLTEAAQAERRAAIGTMAAGIHHEIGNPLNIINTKIQVFLTGIERGFYAEKTREDIIGECQMILNETIRQTNRISEITRKLSNFAKPSKEFKPQLIDIRNEIDEALAVLGHDVSLERIKIIKDLPLDVSKILADRQELQQIFFNLIRNATQAIEGEGAVTIRALPVFGDKVHIEIEDTGKGIAEDKVNRIFEPFFTTKGTKGTGLGLSIVRQLVWRNKGEISFKSRLGAGTTFILEFPAAKQEG